ncbi:MAG: STAS/SEC14 domain-containing protein [Planctomycetota bacterium]
MPHLISLEPRGRIIHALVRGWIDEEAYEHIVPAIDETIFEYDMARLIFDLTDYVGREPGSEFEDIELDLPNWTKLQRVAVIGHERFKPRMEWFCRPFTSATLRFFLPEQKDDADAWIHEGIA